METHWKLLAGIILAFICIPAFAGEDDGRHDSKALYLYPHEVISLEEIQLLDSETRLKIDPDTGIAIPYQSPTEEPQSDSLVPEATDPDSTNDGDNLASDSEEEESGPKSLDTQIREAEGLLRRYYSQFLSEKRIWEDKNRGSKYSTKNEQNEVRLLLLELQSRLSESKLVRDSEIIYSLHKRLGNLYSERENTSNSLRHFQAAYRYRNLSATEEYFLNENVWKEVLDEDSLEKRKVHKRIRDSYLLQIQVLEAEKKKLHRIGSDYAQGKIGFIEYTDSKKSQELVIESEKQKLARLKKDYEDSLEANFEPYRKSKSYEDSANLYKIANLVRKVEEKNKERIKVVNKTSFAGRGVFVLFDYKRNTDFPAYEYLLEQSHRLNPEYIPAIRDIAKQLKIDGKKLPSIDYYNKYVNLIENESDLEPSEKEELSEAYLNLGILNSDLKRKVIAVEFYEKFINLTGDSEKKQRVFYELGRFFEKEIGNLDKSKEYYNQWLSGEPTDKKQLAFAHYALSLYEKKNQYLNREETQLLKAYDNYRELRKELNEKEKEITSLEREINRYKRELLLTTDDESLAQFRILQLKLEDLKLERDKVRSDYLSVPKSRIILRLAEISEINRKLKDAILYYDEIIDIGNETEVSYAVKNRKRIQMTQEDGIRRKSNSLY